MDEKKETSLKKAIDAAYRSFAGGAYSCVDAISIHRTIFQLIN